MALACSRTAAGTSEARLVTLREQCTNVTLDTDYPANGWAITANQLGHGTLIAVKSVSLQSPVGSSLLARWDQASGKLLAETIPNDAATGIDEAATGLDALANVVCYITSIGY
jgi:hypothetical protein